MQVPLPQNTGNAKGYGPAMHSVIPQDQGLDQAPRPVPAHLPGPSLPLPTA